MTARLSALSALEVLQGSRPDSVAFLIPASIIASVICMAAPGNDDADNQICKMAQLQRYSAAEAHPFHLLHFCNCGSDKGSSGQLENHLNRYDCKCNPEYIEKMDLTSLEYSISLLFMLKTMHALHAM